MLDVCGRSQLEQINHFLEENKRLPQPFETFPPPGFLLKVTIHIHLTSHGKVSYPLASFLVRWVSLEPYMKPLLLFKLRSQCSYGGANEDAVFAWLLRFLWRTT